MSVTVVNQKKKPIAVGAHIYAGGFTVGVSKYFDVLAHLEDVGYGEDAVKLNFPNIKVYHPESSWPEKFDQKVDFVFGNPPCAPFSVMPSIKGKDWKTDSRLDHTLNVFNLLMKLQPKVLAIESVSQAWTQGSSFVMSLVHQAEELGYSSTEYLHDSQYYGLPQRRKRTFHIFHNVELDFTPPNFDDVVAVGEALARVKLIDKTQPVEIQEKFSKLYDEARPGEPLSKTFDRVNILNEVERDAQGRVKGRPRFIINKLNPNTPAPTLIGGYNLMHPTEKRYLYLEELVEIMGFPSNYKWPTQNYDVVSHYLSRGVNPIIAESLAKGVYEGIVNNVRITKPTFRVLDWRSRDRFGSEAQTSLL